MPAQTPCPISEVDRALSSYINSREDTLRIRRTLSKYMTSSFRPVNAATQQQHLNHECPQNISAANTNPPGLKDTRLEYLQALRARAQAQAKHRELQASLEQLRTRHVDDNPTQPESEYDNEITRSYVSLLRQRRRHVELQVIQESLDKLLGAKTTTTSDPRDLVKRAIGEQPDLPAERLENLTQTGGTTTTTVDDNQAHLFKLKQQVLEARASMERAQAARKAAQDETKTTPPSTTATTLQSQIYALSKARNEVVDWIQGELAKLEEESLFLEDASPVKRPLANNNGANPATTTDVDMASATAKIQSAYDTYTSARAKLLDAHTSLQNPVPLSSSSPPTTQANESPTTPPIPTKDPLKPINPISTLLPHIHPLLATAHTSRALTQQSIYLSTSLAAADADAEETLLRLAGESHLLPAGSKEVGVWGKMARKADESLESGVKERLEEGKREVQGVSNVVEICGLQGRVLEEM
ncbi:hypothetical protein DDE82_007670 [Stemphylium lycopersici]|uniref:Uncharacterized protein n=1 Tax=Stemphylium lycopersici TaxID=183478 RepID=A0A364NEZ7_STELY|nr:hypothetical protein TW65_08502 [Stemphylium lycopersici]RAR00068.1 hypothetical protein DDE82_007670 [Stemphylium lycopersici]RAR15840.1 hypothetical protein DDE83_000856 [Stemphylium lycopersici]